MAKDISDVTKNIIFGLFVLIFAVGAAYIFHGVYKNSQWTTTNKSIQIIGAIIIPAALLYFIYTQLYKKDSESETESETENAGKHRRAMISVDSRGANDFDSPQAPQASSGRVRPYPCLFMPGGASQETSPICNNNIPWFPPYNRGTWPERFPGRFSSDYAPNYVVPLNERFYNQDVTSEDIGEQIIEEEKGVQAMNAVKRAGNSLANSYARANMKASSKAETNVSGNDGFQKTDFSKVSFMSIPGQYENRSYMSDTSGPKPAMSHNPNTYMNLAQANVARTRSQSPQTPAHVESHYSANSDLMTRSNVPAALSHLSNEELNEAIAEELENMQAFKADQPCGLPVSPDGYDPTRDISSEMHSCFTGHAKGVLTRYANKDMTDKINTLYRQNIEPTEDEIAFDIRSNVRPTERLQDYWLQKSAYETRPAVDSLLQSYNYPAYTNLDMTLNTTDGNTVMTRMGP